MTGVFPSALAARRALRHQTRQLLRHPRDAAVPWRACRQHLSCQVPSPCKVLWLTCSVALV